MFHFRIVGRWSSFASKPVAVGTTGTPSACSLLMAVRSDSSSSAWNPGKTREVSRCSPPIFLLRTLQQRNGRIFVVEGVIALIYRFLFSHHFRHQSHASSVQRGSMQTETADSQPLGKQGIINVCITAYPFCLVNQFNKLHYSHEKSSTWSVCDHH